MRSDNCRELSPLGRTLGHLERLAFSSMALDLSGEQHFGVTHGRYLDSAPSYSLFESSDELFIYWKCIVYSWYRI
jgi:hypothetical protein